MHPVLQWSQMEFTVFRYQTLHLNRKSRLVKAPTGQISTVFNEYGLSSGRLSNDVISILPPRRMKQSSSVLLIKKNGQVTFVERTYHPGDPGKADPNTIKFEFQQEQK